MLTKTKSVSDTAPTLPGPRRPPVAFARGPYGEIHAPFPLVTNTDPDQAVNDMLSKHEGLGGKPLKKPTGGMSLMGAQGTALMAAHQLRLREVLAGDVEHEGERQLFEMVTIQGELLSIRPPLVSNLVFGQFAPVLRCLTPGHPSDISPQTWQMGIEGKGKHQQFEAKNPAEALEQAQRLFVTWYAEDMQGFNDHRIKPALEKAQPSLFHSYWLAALEARSEYDFGQYKLKMVGRHNSLTLTNAKGYERILETERGRAVRIADALARAENHSRRWPAQPTLTAWLDDIQAPQFEIMEWGATANLPVIAEDNNGNRFALLKRKDTLVVQGLDKNNQYTGKLAETATEPPFQMWIDKRDADGVVTLFRWAAYEAAQAKVKKE